MYLRAINEEKIKKDVLEKDTYVSDILERNFDVLLNDNIKPDENNLASNAIMSIFLNRYLIANFSDDQGTLKRLKENEKEIKKYFNGDGKLFRFKDKNGAGKVNKYLDFEQDYLSQKYCNDKDILIDYISYEKGKKKELISKLNGLTYHINSYMIDHDDFEKRNYDQYKSYYIYYSLVYFKNYDKKTSFANRDKLDEFLDDMREGFGRINDKIFEYNAENNYEDKNPYGEICGQDDIEKLKEYIDILNARIYVDDDSLKLSKEIIAKFHSLYDTFMSTRVTKLTRRKILRDCCMDFIKDSFRNIGDKDDEEIKLLLKNTLDDVKQLINIAKERD